MNSNWNEPGSNETTQGDLAVRLEHVRANFWKKLKRVIARVPFAEDLIAAYYCAMDPATPTRVKAMLLSALAYFILPMDIIPDFIVGAGFTDDAAVLAMVVGLVSQHIKPAHRLAAASVLESDLSEEMGETART